MKHNRLSDDEKRLARKSHALAICAPVISAAIWMGIVTAVWLAGRNLLDMKEGTVIGWLNIILGITGSVASVLVFYPIDNRRLWIAAAYIIASPFIFMASSVVMLIAMSFMSELLF